jgi:hypothetical protein
MSIELKLFEKEGFIFNRINKNHYNIEFNVENKNIILPNIIDFNLINLIYNLNSDIYEKMNLDILNQEEVIATILLKNIFEELGLSQKYSFLQIKREIENNKIIFRSKTIYDEKPVGIPMDAELLQINNIVIICDIKSIHNIHFDVVILFDNNINIQVFIEKIIGIILYKIFKRVKQFIENVYI